MSLVPSQTELLYHLGLEEETVGITKFCVHPPQWHRSKQRVGGTKNLDIDRITALGPDLIIANQEENVKEQVSALEGMAPILVTDIKNLDDTYALIEGLGKIVQREGKARYIADKIRTGFESLPSLSRSPTVLYLIWKGPWMSVGGDTFIHDLLHRCGLRNACGHWERYPSLSAEDIIALDPEYVFLSSEPYPFKENHIREINEWLPKSRIILVDGEMFSWYGSRQMFAPDYLGDLLGSMARESP